MLEFKVNDYVSLKFNYPDTEIYINGKYFMQCFSLIDTEEEFWGHCSNLQAWSEHDYDTRLLKVNLAFPLLEQLAEAGDNLARIKFKEEILKRLLSGS
jgi:hypothetical protein